MPGNPSLKPNQEQQNILDAFLQDNQIVVVNALAGTGKTSTLRLLAETQRGKRGCYLAFNARLAKEARSKFPANFSASTTHALAFHTPHPFRPDKTFAELYGSRKLRSESKIKPNYILTLAFSRHNPRIVPPEIVSAVSETITRFCHSADDRISNLHVPEFITRFKPQMISELIQTAQKVFDFYANLGELPDEGAAISHDIYLKLYSLSNPDIPAEIVFLDEAQDANPCLIRIIETQIRKGKKIVIVGDSYQHIYGFRLATDAMAFFAQVYPQSLLFPLNRSYRFGPRIAEIGNLFLQLAGCPWKLVGLGADGQAGDQSGASDWTPGITTGNAYIYRSNFALLSDLMETSLDLHHIRVIGGTEEMVHLLVALEQLYRNEQPKHPEIGMFKRWNEIQSFAETLDGSHLIPLVTYVDRNNGNVSHAIQVLRNVQSFNPGQSQQADEYAILTTAHKAKGLEFKSVYVNSDMSSFLKKKKKKEEEAQMNSDTPPSLKTKAEEEAEEEAEFAEIAVSYVAVTRAQKHLYAYELTELARYGLSQGWFFIKPAPRLLSAASASSVVAPTPPTARPEQKSPGRKPAPTPGPAVAATGKLPVPSEKPPARPANPVITQMRRRIRELGLEGQLLEIVRQLKS